ncbi:MAG TPA: thiamine pyrophosphate-binding protein [Symbiobacteriaceae bacterium]|nr:thiamine pyrophosphate-binding protein [Symbiobacteriaceae bacterium]
MNVAEFTLEQLAAWGVRRAYGVMGDAILPLMDALARQQVIQFVQVRQEAAAGFMASAEAKLTGVPAVCIGTSGPGLANLINGVADAYADRVPLLVLTGQVESYKVGTDVKQEVNQQALMSGLAGYSALVAGPGGAPQVLVQALKTAVGEGRGAQVSVPKDYWSAPCDGARIHPPEPFLTAPPVVSAAVLAQAAEVLGRASRPVIMAGHGARPAAGALLALAEAWGAGIVVALGGKGMLPGAHPLVLGGVGAGGSEAAHRALKECDLVLIAGSTWWPAQYMPSGVPVVQVDRCPGNIGLKVAVDFGLPGDCAAVLPSLVPVVARCKEWAAQLAGYRREWDAVLQREVTAEADGVSPAALVHTLEAVLPPDAVVTLDTGDHVLWFNRHFRGSGAGQVLLSGTWRTMGYGLPAASAAALARPGATVAALVGDGGLTMQLGELAVPAQLGLNLTVVVARNGALALEEFKARSEGLQPFGHTLNNPDFAAVARAFGWQAWRVESPAELEPALRQAVAHPGPALVDVNTAKDGSLHK